MKLLRLKTWILIALLGLLWHYYEPMQRRVHEFLNRPPPLEQRYADSLELQIGYRLYLDRWIAIPLTLNGNIIRILTNSEVDHDAPDIERSEWKYTISYRLEDADGEIAMEGDYHHSTRLTRFQLPENEEIYTPALFRDPRTVLADTRMFPVNLTSMQRPITLFLKLKQRDDLFHDTLVRVFMEELIEPDKAPVNWRRLSPDARDDIAKASLYPADLLTPREQINLMTDIWRPQGPRGVPDIDYEARPFLVWEDAIENHFVYDGQGGGSVVQRQGLPFGPHLYGVIPIPEEGGRVRLNLASRLRDNPQQAGLQIRWFGRMATERKVIQQQWVGEDIHLTLESGGLLLLSSPEPMVVRAFLPQDNADIEITPKHPQAAYWLASGERKLTFPIHLQEERKPLRIQLRSISISNYPAQLISRSIKWSFRDTNGQVINEGIHPWSAQLSQFDRLPGSEFESEWVTDPELFYLHVPKGSSQLHFSGSAPIWISVANRPLGLKRQQMIPEDAYPQESRVPVPIWFPIRPLDWQQREQRQESRLFRLQRRPPEESEESSWFALEVNEDEPGRYLLTPRDPRSPPLGASSHGVGYRELPTDRQSKITLHTGPGRTVINPSLLFQRRGEGEAAPLEIIIDGQPFHNSYLPGASGEIPLPPLTPGAHQIELKTPFKGRFFISHAAYPNHIKRYSVPIRAGQTLSYQINKSRRPHKEGSVISARIFAPAEAKGRILLQARFNKSRRLPDIQLKDWTLFNRHYDLRIAGGEPGLILGSRGLMVDSGQPFFIPLGRDLRPEEHRLTLSMQQGPTSYLVVGESRADTLEQRQLFIEGINP